MSDVQNASIDDQRDTATGGLVNDTPGLPTQPPSSPGIRPPSFISGVAQMLKGGAPAPKPAQPGRSPYQFPGQSQVPPGGPQSTQNASRWTGTTASLAVPKGSVQPQANFTPFMPGKGTTSHDQWGQIEPYPDLPQPFEAPGLFSSLANFFGNTGSPAVAMLALSMGKNGSAFMDGVMKGQEWKAKMHRQQMEDDAKQLEITQWKEMHDYQDIVNEYTTASGATGAEAAKNYSINGVTMLDALANHATELGDDKLLAVLGTGSVDKAAQFLNERNNNWQSLSKTNQSVEKQAEEDGAEDYGVPQELRNTGASGGAGLSPFQRAAQGEPATTQGGPAPTPASVMKPLGPNGELAGFQQSGLDFYREGESLNNVPKGPARRAAGMYAQGLGAAVDDIKRKVQRGEIKPEEVPDALNQIIPGMGTDYSQTYRGVPMPTGKLASTPYWQSIKNLAVPDPLTQSATIKDFSSAGASGKRLQAGARMGPAAVTVLEALKKVPEGEPVPYYMADALIAGKWTGDPKYQGLFNALNTYIQDAQSLQSPTGRFFVTEVESLKKNLQITSGPQAVRTFLQQDAENSTALADQLVREYQHGAQRAGESPTSYDEPNFSLLKTISRLDPQHGFEGVGDLPPQLQGLGLGKTDSDTPTPTIQPGTVEDGWRFKGGNPGDQGNWEKVQ